MSDVAVGTVYAGIVKTKSGWAMAYPDAGRGAGGANVVSPAGIPWLTQSTSNCFSWAESAVDCAKCGCPSPAGQGGMWLLCTANETPIPCFFTCEYVDNPKGAIPPARWQLPQCECTMQAMSDSHVGVVWADAPAFPKRISAKKITCAVILACNKYLTFSRKVQMDIAENRGWW